MLYLRAATRSDTRTLRTGQWEAITGAAGLHIRPSRMDGSTLYIITFFVELTELRGRSFLSPEHASDASSPTVVGRCGRLGIHLERRETVAHCDPLTRKQRPSIYS